MGLFDLTGRTAIVTGGSRGIGRACCLALAQQGAYVAINYASNDAAAAETLEKVRAAGGEGELMKFDAADAEAVTKAVDDLHKRRGALHIAVANAGIAIDKLLLRVKDEDLAKTMATNLNGAVYLARASIRHMMKPRFGRVIFMSSVVGEMGNAGQATYAASKGALLALAKTLAKEYGSRGITVNAITPGFIETDMTASIPEAGRQGMLAATPLGRLGKPEEIGAAVAYLSSLEAGYITGHALRVNGGLYV
ncbi:MAG: 3-oxoacyl-ACP reductase FabG [Deltaproteobacteria bacterium]